jgi:hypothetical protein
MQSCLGVLQRGYMVSTLNLSFISFIKHRYMMHLWMFWFVGIVVRSPIIPCLIVLLSDRHILHITPHTIYQLWSLLQSTCSSLDPHWTSTSCRRVSTVSTTLRSPAHSSHSKHKKAIINTMLRSSRSSEGHIFLTRWNSIRNRDACFLGQVSRELAGLSRLFRFCLCICPLVSVCVRHRECASMSLGLFVNVYICSLV